MRLLFKLLVVAVALLLLGLAVASPHPKMVPIRLGTAEVYWAAATGVRGRGDLGGPADCMLQPIDGWFLYTVDHMHGSDCYRVKEAEVLADFPKALAELGGKGKFVPEWNEDGFRNWEKADPKRTNALLLVLHLKSACLSWWIKSHPKNFPELADFQMGIAYQRMGQFRLVQLVEWCYLSALILFTAWPWIRNRSRWTWAVHAAMIPPLLMLPYFMGYCAWSYTSVGPAGGIVYPLILDVFPSLTWFSFDNVIIDSIPRVLAPLTGPLGTMYSVSGRGGPGPTAVLCLGLVLGSVVIGCAPAVRWLRGRRKKELQLVDQSQS